MRRLTLFPPPGTVETLPESVLNEAGQLLADLIIAVLEKSAENPPIDDPIPLLLGNLMTPPHDRPFLAKLVVG